jgi:hypothetical protein
MNSGSAANPKRKGSYVNPHERTHCYRLSCKDRQGPLQAHADVFPITTTPASTQRGAMRKLREAVLVLLRDAAESGSLMNLEEAGYITALINFEGSERAPIIFDEHTVTVPVGRSLQVLNRKKEATGEEDNDYALK